ncbi:MAG: hypothetical protein Kow00108_03470 [Calditrichia bacterium]
MKKLLQSLLIVVGILNFVAAQPTSDESLAGRKAIQFSIGSNFKLGYIDGSIISFRYHISDRSAIRIGLSSNYTNGDESYELIINNSNDPDPETIDSTEFSIILSSYYFRYFNSTGKIRGYAGLGPYFSYFYSKYNTSFTYDNTKLSLKSIGFGLQTIIGIEWRLKPYLCVLGEYVVRYSYIKDKYSNNEDFGWENRREKKYINVEPGDVRMGVAFYF